DRRGRAALTGALHAEIERSVLIAAINDVAAVLGHGRADAAIDQFLDQVDDLGVVRAFLYRGTVAGNADAGRRPRPEQGRAADEMVEQYAEDFRLKRLPMHAGRGTNGDKVSAEKYAVDQSGGE